MKKKNLPPQMGLFDVDVEVENEVSGIEMGVLDNGMAYLTQSGLAAMVGISRQTIANISKEWEADHDNDLIDPKTRIGYIRERLLNDGYDMSSLYVATKKGNHHAYPDLVCVAILEYFAFESKNPNQKARNNFRRLAGHGFRQFVYASLHYQPEDPWKHYHDRVSLLRDSSPDGYFFVFNEVDGMIVDLIRNGIRVNDKTIPDISIGAAWGNYWTSNPSLNDACGDRKLAKHSYPPYFPQAKSNPQDIWAYPDSSLPEFRFWFKNIYLTTKFPSYILKKAKLLKGGSREARRLSEMYQNQKLSDPSL